MDLTDFIISRRNEALLVGDYGLYRKQLSRRLLTVRRKLGRTSPKARKYTAKAPITAEDIASNEEFIHLLLLTSERAWAHAMHMKSMRSADSSAKAISGPTRKHIISRLNKAARVGAQLVDLLKANHGVTARPHTVLEAWAYQSMLWGVLEFESQKWEKCLQAYSEAYTIYTSFAKPASGSQGDGSRDFLSSTIEPSIRYAAYQLRLPRTMSIDSIVSHFPSKEAGEIRELLRNDPSNPSETTSEAKEITGSDAKDLPKTITWRARIVKIEDARIAQALATVSAAEKRLTALLSSAKDMASKEKAAAYDEVLIPSQDAVDATKTAIDELTSDGVTQSDQRMQALQITRTAVNYALIGWRIGRNRVLCGKEDGAHIEIEMSKLSRKRKKDALDKTPEESNGRKLARLRERVALYDTTLQSLESIKGLPGVAADQTLMAELDMKRFYFAALRCLSIARSHALLGNTKNALALFARATDHISRTSSSRPNPSTTAGKPPNLDVTQEQLGSLHKLLKGLLIQHQALVELHSLSSDAAKAAQAKENGFIPLIERLDEYPPNGADLTKLVIYPPTLRPIPVKPLFLDIAWNYIEYPGRGREPQSAGVNGSPEESKEYVEQKSQGRKGWFGFGR